MPETKTTKSRKPATASKTKPAAASAVVPKTKKSKKTTTETSASTTTQELKLKKVKKPKKTTTAPTASATPVERRARVEVDLATLNIKNVLTIAELDPLTVSQLKSLCRDRKVAGYSGKRKGDIMQLLTEPPVAAAVVVEIPTVNPVAAAA